MAVVEHPGRAPETEQAAPSRLGEWLRGVPTAYWVVGIALLLMPAVAGVFRARLASISSSISASGSSLSIGS
jgi:hypothetical protein